MTIAFPCWNCGKQLKAKAEHASRKCKCTKCDSINSIPGTKVYDPALDDVEHEKESEQEELSEIEEQVTQPSPLDATPFPVTDIPLLERPTNRKGPNWLFVTGGLLLAVGIMMLLYYLVIFDTTVPEFDLPFEHLNVRRYHNVGLMNHKIVGCIASGIFSLIGTIFVVAGSFKTQTTGSK